MRIILHESVLVLVVGLHNPYHTRRDNVKMVLKHLCQNHFSSCCVRSQFLIKYNIHMSGRLYQRTADVRYEDLLYRGYLDIIHRNTDYESVFLFLLE